MGDHNVIADVGDALVRLLKLGMQEAFPTDPPEITLKSPSEISEDGDTGDRQLSLFLYRIVEDPDLKNLPESVTDPLEQRRLPLPLHLHYLVTPYSKDKADEHRILGRAMQVLHDHGVLGEAELATDKGGLAEAHEQLRVTLHPLDVETTSQVWNSLSVPYRLSICYQVTPALIESEREEVRTRITERVEDFASVSASREQR